jgi:hypothetical protein
MSPGSILLRVLLSLSLVLDAAVPAVAQTLVQALATPAAEQASAGNAPCHLHDARPAVAHDGPPAVASRLPTNPKHPSPDCCGSDCRCACVHTAQAVMPVAATVMAPPVGDQAVRQLPPAHASPALPQLIRPPIG